MRATGRLPEPFPEPFTVRECTQAGVAASRQARMIKAVSAMVATTTEKTMTSTRPYTFFAIRTSLPDLTRTIYHILIAIAIAFVFQIYCNNYPFSYSKSASPIKKLREPAVPGAKRKESGKKYIFLVMKRYVPSPVPPSEGSAESSAAGAAASSVDAMRYFSGMGMALTDG